jgi:hypothetical protein
MNQEFTYQSDDYGRQSQRFVIPLYLKDELGNYEFSSTATLVKYQEHHYILFAAHALCGGANFDDVHTFGADGQFHKIMNFAIDHQIFKDEDIAIVDCFNRPIEGKNYFDISKKSLIGFEKKAFAWTGFPVSQSSSKKIHRNKTQESLKNKYIYDDDNESYFTNARYFTIISKLQTNNKIEITGKYDRKNANLKYKGVVSTGPHPKGMSGGAMYYFAKNRVLKENLDDTFRFAGIGIGYKKDNTIVGVPSIKIIELIEIFCKNNPLKLILIPDVEFN